MIFNSSMYHTIRAISSSSIILMKFSTEAYIITSPLNLNFDTLDKNEAGIMCVRRVCVKRYDIQVSSNLTIIVFIYRSTTSTLELHTSDILSKQ